MGDCEGLRSVTQLVIGFTRYYRIDKMNHVNPEKSCKSCLTRSIATVLITLFAATTSLAQDQQARLDTLRAEGYEALYNLDYIGARARFQKMVDLAPDNPAGAQCYASSLWLQQL